MKPLFSCDVRAKKNLIPSEVEAPPDRWSGAIDLSLPFRFGTKLSDSVSHNIDLHKRPYFNWSPQFKFSSLRGSCIVPADHLPP